VLPSLVVHRWDFTAHPVCSQAKAYRTLCKSRCEAQCLSLTSKRREGDGT